MPNVKHVYHLFVIKVRSKDSDRSKLRNELQNFLTAAGIGTGLHYAIPLHEQNCFKNLGYKKGDFPVTEELAETGISLPMYPELTDEQIGYVCDKIKEFFKK
jgi:dTDP-4-amino-4,6-dideoxygalactose transaminase